MRVFIQGQGVVSLTQGDYVAGGGEGDVYVKGSTAFKVYKDPARCIPAGKVAELSLIGATNVIKPERMLLDAKDRPIGYTMRFVSDTIPLCQTFTRAFRDREGLDTTTVTSLVRDLRANVEDIHRAGVLIVDLNEMNLLVDRKFNGAYFIDVDSYQTRNYPATAIMPSVRDWKVIGNDFNEGSDWFSFACVVFQMWVGIHPFKGKHPTVHGLEERMKAGISVFDPSVSMPKAAYPFDTIPAAYRTWLKAVLQDGVRAAPPSGDLGATMVILPTATIVGTANLDINEVLSLSTPVYGYIENGGSWVAWTGEGMYLDGRRVGDAPRKGARGVFSPKMNTGIVADLAGDGTFYIYDTQRRTFTSTLMRADELSTAGGHLILRNKDKILRVVLTDMPNKVVASTSLVANCMEYATKLFDGCAVQNMLGSTFVSLITAQAAHQVRISELDGYTLVEAKYENLLLMVLGTKGNGQYDRFTFIFDAEHKTYRMSVQKDVSQTGLNFLVLDNGIVVHLTEDEKLRVSDTTTGKVRLVESNVLGNDMRLVKHQGRVGFIRDNKVYSMRMR